MLRFKIGHIAEMSQYICEIVWGRVRATSPSFARWRMEIMYTK